MKGANNSYFGSMAEAIKTSITGFKLTFKHMKDAVAFNRRGTESASDQNYFKNQEGIVTLQYPKEQIPVPDNGRYKLHNEMEDCIVCDKCAKICPVNCIDIEPIKSTEAIGETSDGTVKRLYAAKFDIDMAKCCFCGLCTTVCPTECLTMTKEYDFSVFDINEMNFEFAELTPAEADEKRKAYDEAQRVKKEKALAAKQAASEKTPEEKKSSVGKPVFRPKLKPKVAGSSPAADSEKKSDEATSPATKKPAFRPKMKAVVKPKPGEGATNESTETPKPKFRPKIKAKIKPKETEETKTSEEQSAEAKAEKPKFRPKIRPKIKVKEDTKENVSESASEELKAETPEAKKVFRPKIRPKIKPKTEEKPENQKSETKEEGMIESKPVFKPKMRPVIKKKKEDED
ncbi:MAG: 4Fe-4S dicluster domain-containing protein [Flammeovirgaceae bacterium]|nr:4Fe-4S dicluster domain-containing protein [Flammeovirgaceae bacterium]